MTYGSKGIIYGLFISYVMMEPLRACHVVQSEGMSRGTAEARLQAVTTVTVVLSGDLFVSVLTRLSAAGLSTNTNSGFNYKDARNNQGTECN